MADPEFRERTQGKSKDMRVDVLRCQSGGKIVRAAILVDISWQDGRCWLENVLLKMENLHELQCCFVFVF